MGVAQLTLSSDRPFVTNLCFIRLFSNSSIWRADRGAGTRTLGFRFLTRRACAESNDRGDRPSPPRSCIPTKRAVVPAGTATRSCRTIGHQYYKGSCMKAGGAPSGSVSDPDRSGGLHARPIGDRRSGPASRRPGISLLGLRTSRLNRRQFGGLESAACGSPLRRAYRPYGAVAEWLKAAVC